MFRLLRFFRLGKENQILRQENKKLRDQLSAAKADCQENINAVNRYYKGKLRNTFKKKITQ